MDVDKSEDKERVPKVLQEGQIVGGKRKGPILIGGKTRRFIGLVRVKVIIGKVAVMDRECGHNG